VTNPYRKKAENGYTSKEIFTTKLRGEPFDVLRSTLARDLDEWLIEREIFKAQTGPSINGCRPYTCLHPVRIWYINGRGKHEKTTVDHLQIGDLWTF
jgi:hypothetical protein